MTSTAVAAEPLLRACPLCDSTAARPLWEKGTLRVVTCRACGMAFANPVGAAFASGHFYDDIATAYYLSPEKLAGDYHPTRFARELRLFRRHCPRGAVLDVGCSTGAFLYRLRGLGDYQVTGTDVAGAALDHAAGQGIEVIRTPFLEHDFGGRRFEAITFWAVIEHLVNPRAFLDKAATLLLPGGHCFVLVPNLRSLAIRLCGPKYRYVMPDHVNYFSPATLRALPARNPAFEVLEIGSSHFNPVVIWQDLRHPRDRVPDAERAQLLQRTTRLKERPRLRPLQWAYRLTEALLARAMLADNLFLVLRHGVRS